MSYAHLTDPNRLSQAANYNFNFKEKGYRKILGGSGKRRDRTQESLAVFIVGVVVLRIISFLMPTRMQRVARVIPERVVNTGSTRDLILSQLYHLTLSLSISL